MFTKLQNVSNSTFQDSIKNFVAHFKYNIENEVTMRDLCNAKLTNGEIFAILLQQWIYLAQKCPWPILEEHQVEILIQNLNLEMSF